MRGSGAATEKLGRGITYMEDAEGNVIPYRTTPTGIAPVFDPKTGTVMSKPKSDKVKLAHEHNNALNIMVDDAIEGVTNNPGAFGLKTLAPNLAVDYLDPKNTDTRLLVDRLSSMQIKNFSGAAVSAHEQERLNKFLPRSGEDAGTVTKKLRNYKRQLEIAGYTMGLPGNLPANPATQPARNEVPGIGQAIGQATRDLGNANAAISGAAPVIPKTLTRTLGGGNAPPAAIEMLKSDPTLAPAFKAKYGYLPGE